MGHRQLRTSRKCQVWVGMRIVFVGHSIVRGVAVVPPFFAYVDGGVWVLIDGGSLPKQNSEVNVQYVSSDHVLFLLFLILGVKVFAS